MGEAPEEHLRMGVGRSNKAGGLFLLRRYISIVFMLSGRITSCPYVNDIILPALKAKLRAVVDIFRVLIIIPDN